MTVATKEKPKVSKSARDKRQMQETITNLVDTIANLTDIVSQLQNDVDRLKIRIGL